MELISNEAMRKYFKTKRGRACIIICQGTAFNSIKNYLRRIFAGMVSRCTYPKHPSFKYYGGRGIQCLFLSAEEFIDYVINVLQVDPRGLTIDRIDNNSNYERGNIRFVTRSKNQQNKGPYRKRTSCEKVTAKMS